jgi:hypothetical protein
MLFDIPANLMAAETSLLLKWETRHCLRGRLFVCGVVFVVLPRCYRSSLFGLPLLRSFTAGYLTPSKFDQGNGPEGFVSVFQPSNPTTILGTNGIKKRKKRKEKHQRKPKSSPPSPIRRSNGSWWLRKLCFQSFATRGGVEPVLFRLVSNRSSSQYR